MAKRVWALDADLAAAFDRIDHSQLASAARVVPGQGHDPGLAEGGRVRGGQGVRADRGGNSPGRRDFTVLLNVALHGLEEAAGVRYQACGIHAAVSQGAAPRS